ncbi:MAG: hypothetical protein U0792_20870 [Gemmataceae bacterium]
MLLTLRPASDPNALPLLAVAVQHHFRRTIEDDPKLFQGLAFAQLERIGKAQEQGTAQLAEQLARIEGRLGQLHATLGTQPVAEVPPREMARPVVPEDQTNGPVAVSPDGKIAVCGSPYDGKLRVFDVASGKELRRLAGHASWVTCVAFTPDGRRVISGGRDGAVKVWELATGRMLRTFTHPKTVPATVALSPDGKKATATGEDGTVRVWNVG